MLEYPLIRPYPPRLSMMTAALQAIEDHGVYSNGGPVVRGFEHDITRRLFEGSGNSLAVANATLGLMLALKRVQLRSKKVGGLVLMPAFTFAATAHAAQWAGLTPLICDVDRDDWVSSARAEEELLRRFDSRVVAMLPYATFGADIDLDRYNTLGKMHGVDVVVDAAASLGTTNARGTNFGAGAPFAVVYSMHATKTFATAEGGLIHSADIALIDELRQMANFGFGAERSASLPGLNAKLPEVLGLLAQAKLDEIEEVCTHRALLGDAYRQGLADICGGQRPTSARQALQFWPMLIPTDLSAKREQIVSELAARGVGAGQYFSPHLGQQSHFQETALIGPTPVADEIAARMVSLPITDAMTVADVERICERVRSTIRTLRNTLVPKKAAPARRPIVSALLIGGGPAGTALLTAASKQGRLVDLARKGFTIVEQGAGLGDGALGGYAIRSDSTADTFLSAVRDNIHPEIAALMDHPAGRLMAKSADALGAPLVDAGWLLSVTGARLKAIVEEHGGRVLMQHRAQSARRMANGMWRTMISDASGATHEMVSQHIVLATGGFQCWATLASTPVAGARLDQLAGDRLVASDAFLKLGGINEVRARTAKVRAPRIAIVGGSTSALASAILLLKADPALALGANAITILHRRPLRPFYPSVEAAHSDGFSDFCDDDICPVSGFVYRLTGFRLEARELVLRMLGIGGRAPDPRVRLYQIDGEHDGEAQAVIEAADIVIGATGYKPNAFPLFNVDGTPIPLACQQPGGGPLVDRYCRVINAQLQPVPAAYGIGLAAGFRPWGPLGGEPSFRGQANGLWLWQNDVGMLIVDDLLKDARRAVA
ncbi:DegT/DnrJ/EryC1/StrS family aminotransferase [Sphingomonas crocodyli]|uniref:Aminotransferase DegT n=1 Tax=Sphingomonas crocodyli TaxID=1979270 RepID=A0A437LXV0_9SPHN|nr:DegT/DnrJ/EryC1/StrS family aminotransferase [Sphingomonas crocodyli]RVT90235.1 aminotransferase DegT [Sphingomonas crocodyli]